MKQTKFEQFIANVTFTILLIYFIGAILFSLFYSKTFLREAFQSFVAMFTLVAFNVYLDKKNFAINFFDRMFETSFFASTIWILLYCHEAFFATTSMLILFTISILLNIFMKKLNIFQ